MTGKNNIRRAREIEREAKEGNLLVFQIESYERENPSLVTEDARRFAYEADIPLRLKQASSSGHIKGNIESLKEAEQRFFEAEKLGYKTDFSSFKKTIDELMKGYVKCFERAKLFCSYLEESNFDFSEYIGELKAKLPELAKETANHVLKKTKAAAKRLRKNCREIDKDLVKNVQRSLEYLDELRDFGVDEHSKVNEIREIAYKRGVEFVIEKAISYAHTDQKRSRRLLDRAEINANILGRDISERVEYVKGLYSGDDSSLFCQNIY